MVQLRKKIFHNTFYDISFSKSMLFWKWKSKVTRELALAIIAVYQWLLITNKLARLESIKIESFET